MEWHGNPFFMEVLRDALGNSRILACCILPEAMHLANICKYFSDAGRPAMSCLLHGPCHKHTNSLERVRQQSRLLDAVEEWKKHSPPEGTVV